MKTDPDRSMSTNGDASVYASFFSTQLMVFSLNQKAMLCLFLGGEAAQKQQPSIHY
jgi:hypothetical protein